MEFLIPLVHIDRSHSISSSAFHSDNSSLLLVVVGLEMALNLTVIAFYPFFCYFVMNSTVVHRNIRLQLCTAATVHTIGVLVRFYLFYCLYTGADDRDVVYTHLAAELARDLSRTLAVSIVTSFAIERTVATYAWEWYEKASCATISVFILTESFNMFTMIVNEVLKYMVSVHVCFIFMVCVEGLGFMAFLRIYKRNVKVEKRLEIDIELYSIAQKFQVRENLEVLRFMLGMVKVWVTFVSLSFITYGFFAFGPSDLESLRNFSYCVFEVLSALYYSSFYYLGITGNIHIHKQFRSLCCCRRGDNNIFPADQQNNVSDSQRYFADLRLHWS